jgi:UPF0755 protein
LKDEQRISEERRKKAEHFRVDIRDSSQSKGEYPDTTISSYSDPSKAQESRRALAEGIPDKKAQLVHELRDREKGRKNRRFFRWIWFLMVLLVSLLLARYAVAGVNDMLAVGRQNVNVTVEIPKNSSLDFVAEKFYKTGAIQDVGFFKLYAKLTKAPKTYQGGSFQISTNMDYEALLQSIQSLKNRVDVVKVLFPEGLNASEIADKLEKNGICSAKDALAVIQGTSLDSSFSMLKSISNSSERYYRLEGYLFPDTYKFYKNEDAKSAVKKLVSNCNTKLTKQIRTKAAEKGMTVDQLLTLASMIQSEAADKSDMYKVSSVFHNRLNSKKTALRRLESDSTLYYPYRKQSLIPEDLRSTFKSRYNTYSFEGLPPGPICSPGLDAIDAALNPDSTGYYYFCHSSKGKAYYAKTKSGHDANLKKAGLR